MGCCHSHPSADVEAQPKRSVIEVRVLTPPGIDFSAFGLPSRGSALRSHLDAALLGPWRSGVLLRASGTQLDSLEAMPGSPNRHWWRRSHMLGPRCGIAGKGGRYLAVHCGAGRHPSARGRLREIRNGQRATCPWSWIGRRFAAWGRLAGGSTP